jgi:hypothetical protein
LRLCDLEGHDGLRWMALNGREGLDTVC